MSAGSVGLRTFSVKAISVTPTTVSVTSANSTTVIRHQRTVNRFLSRMCQHRQCLLTSSRHFRHHADTPSPPLGGRCIASLAYSWQIRTLTNGVICKMSTAPALTSLRRVPIRALTKGWHVSLITGYLPGVRMNVRPGTYGAFEGVMYPCG